MIEWLMFAISLPLGFMLIWLLICSIGIIEGMTLYVVIKGIHDLINKSKKL